MVQPDRDLISFSPPPSPVHPSVVEEFDSNDFTARDYQDELLAIAMDENVILYLPTGSGKTFIATMLIKYFSGGIEKKFSDGGKRAFFLVNTVALVSQQSQVIKRHTSFNVGQYSGDMNVDLWTVDKWMEELEDNSVIVMTAQILLNMLQHYYIKLQDIKVIVFDECHRAVKDHPMRSIMKYFENVSVEDHPRVLGLTGSLLNSTVKVHQVSSYIRDIETTFLSRIITAKDDDMANKINKFSTDPIEHLIFYKQHGKEDVPFYAECKKHFDTLKSFLLSVLLEEAETDAPPKPRETCIRISDELKVNKRLCNLMEDVMFQMADLGMYGGFKATLAHIIQLERLKRNANNSALVSCLQSMITTMTMIRRILGNAISEHPLGEAILKFSTYKIVTLVNLLREVKHDDSVIIFVERRFTCKVIFYILQDLSKAGILPNIRSDFIVGYNNNPFNDTREGLFEKKLNKDVLKKFNSGGTNVLVASDVLEEGIDVQSCNYVIEFNPPRTARSYIQSKGRARKKDSKYFIMVGDNDLKFANESYKLFQELEEVLKRELVGKFIHRTAPSQEELDQSIFNHAIEPYYPRGPDGPMIAAAAAISLLNRYCSSLHVDYFTKLTLYLWKEKLPNGKVVVRLQFPNASPVRETIRGNAMESMDLAKRSAALEGCKVLYEYKELNDHLLPRGRSSEAMEDAEMFPNWSDEESDNDSTDNCGEGVKSMEQKYLQPGTKKRKRLYLKKYPDSWTGCRPDENSVVYMHVIHMHPNYPVPENSRRKVFYELLKSDDEFAILSSKPMPRMAEFPLFMSTGEVRISFTPNVKVLYLTKQQITQIVNFHSLLFTNILCTVHSFMYHDFGNLEQSFLIAPIMLVKSDVPPKPDDPLPFEINWDVVVNNQSLPPIEPLSKEVRKSIKVTNENYNRCVVVPWYRGFAPRQAYIVTAISEDENAHSPFPSDEFDDYTSYFTSKYSSVNKLYSPNEMLLEVRTVSSRLNCLRPRTVSHSTSKRRRKDEEEFEETLVAELCVKFDVPGVVWLKATLLPSIIHRFTYLLLAEELKNTITNRLIEEIDEVDSLCLRGAKTGHNSLLPVNQPLKNGSQSDSQFSPRKKVKLEPSYLVNDDDDVDDGIDYFSNFSSQGLGLEDRLQPLEVDQMSMVENDEDLLRSGPTAKTVTIKPKTTLPIKIEDPIYPWRDEQEPIDFQRHIDEVKLIDIYFFDDFISKPLTPVKSQHRTKFVVKGDHNPDAHGDNWCPGKIKSLNFRANFSAPSLTIFQDADKFRIATNVQQNELIRVLTAASAHDVFNLERLETLGDSFLKYSVSLILYLSYPRLTEGQLTSLKGKIIGNRNLFYCGRKFEFGSIVKVTEFNTERDWVPPGFCIDRKLQKVMRQVAVNPRFLFNDCCSLSKEEQVSGQMFPETIKRIHEHLLESQEETDISNLVDATFLSQQLVTDKTIADCVEALLGLYIKNCGLEMGFHLLKLLGVMKKSIITTDIYRLGVVPSSRLSNVGNIDFHLHNPGQLEHLINYRFNDRSFLLQALSHPTYQPNNITPTYQRLEFLGDAILDFLITTYIFETCSKLTPGELTDLRSALVNNITLATISVRIGLHKYLLMRSCKLSEVIDMFVQRQEERQHEVDDQVLFLIEEEDIRLAEAVEVPKVLGDIFESLVAAIFLDSGKCLKATWNFIYRCMRKEIEAFSTNVPKNHVRLLYEENVGVKFSRCTVIEEFGCVMVPVKIFYNNEYKSFHGFGETKAQAKRAAAKLALRHIHS